MVVEACRSNFLKGEVFWEGATVYIVSVHVKGYQLDDALEFLYFVDDLNTMLVLFLGRLLSHTRKVAVDRHYGWSCRMSSIGSRSIAPLRPLRG